MASTIFFLFICILFGNSFFHHAQGQRLKNVTVDDSHESIHYSGNWIVSEYNNLDEGGYHKLTQDPSAEAVFRFTGVAVYFMSPLWPYEVTTQLQIDSRPPVTVDLRDYNSPRNVGGWETVGSSVVWGVNSLENAQHELRIRVASGEEWAIVDTLIYTVVEAQDQKAAPLPPNTSTESSFTSTSPESSLHPPIPTSSSPPPTTTSAVPPPTGPVYHASSSGPNLLVVGIGAALATLVLLGLIGLSCFLISRQRRGDHEQALTSTQSTSYKSPSHVSTPTTPNIAPPLFMTLSHTASNNSLSLRANEPTSSVTMVLPPRAPPPVRAIEMRTIPRGPSLDLPPPDYYDNSNRRVSLYRSSRASRWTSRLSSQMRRNSSRYPTPVPPIPVHLQFQPVMTISRLLRSDNNKPSMSL